MPRPEQVTNEDISRWDEIIDNDINLPPIIAKNAVIREVCYAGQWLSEELRKLNCSEDHIIRITYTAGKLSFGREPWSVHQQLLDAYQQNELEFEPELSELN